MTWSFGKCDDLTMEPLQFVGVTPGMSRPGFAPKLLLLVAPAPPQTPLPVLGKSARLWSLAGRGTRNLAELLHSHRRRSLSGSWWWRHCIPPLPSSGTAPAELLPMSVQLWEEDWTSPESALQPAAGMFFLSSL